ncbi:gamma-glutamylcyclotransferase [Myxococcus sp. K15C18031901]|uniref:gamma-glutamylcyclotransferase family protein n=1 Tax=Myxococcus dinghuensis TaxID=2906761 RepID=UPI0020A7B78C|nr:gamma-glutamylcyclotransferase family protein [Myxococcus dinghuensis]MCP3104545.1 gamma-glutamylcyclotransferase [Myxococcus dinghuensis]
MTASSAAPTRVFVYGTLIRGQPNHPRLRGARFLGPTLTPASFSLFDYGPFPALAAGGQTTVVGEVYEVDALTLAALDRLEGHPHFYERTSIALDGFGRVEAYLFPEARLVGRPLIASGCWRTHLVKEKKP